MLEEPGDGLGLKLAPFMQALQGLARVHSIFLMQSVLVMTECLTEKERRNLLGLRFEGIPSVMGAGCSMERVAYSSCLLHGT